MAINSDILNSLIPYFTKVLTATLCGSIIGLERELKKKAAGLRTMILICVGCTLMTIVSYKVSTSADPSRIIAQIITGVGFLGAGAVVKNDDRVVGVTTAAFIWVIASIGIMIGVGEITASIFLTLGMVFLSLLLNKVEDYIRKEKTTTNTTIK